MLKNWDGISYFRRYKCIDGQALGAFKLTLGKKCVCILEGRVEQNIILLVFFSRIHSSVYWKTVTISSMVWLQTLLVTADRPSV